MGTFRGLVEGLNTQVKPAHTPWSRPRETPLALIPALVRREITSSAMGLLPTCGYFC